MIEVSNLSYHYAGSRHQVFSQFGLTIQENRIYGLLGKNGTGKSTLLYLISGLLRAQQGQVLVDGNDASKRLPEMLREIYVVPEEYDMPRISLNEFIDINRRFYPRFSEDVLFQCLRDFEMTERPNLKELSMGQKKKVFMSFAMAAGTRYLLMDEPTNGLDIPSKSLFRKVVASHMDDQRTLIISTHQVHDVEALLDHILILDQSHLLLDSSVADITSQYAFKYLQPSEMNDTVVYAEPSLQGNAVLKLREQGEEETQLNLELLFNAVIQQQGGLAPQPADAAK